MSRSALREPIGETTKNLDPIEVDMSGSASPVDPQVMVKASAPAKVNNFMEEPGIAICIKSTTRAPVAAADFTSAIASLKPKKQITAQVN